ncbi:MAG: LuxR family transcriptional regulator, partial [Actinobacteria bacterium]
AERLADSLDLLTSGSRTADPRHRTLRATLQWSYELLSEPERKLFCRFSVFAAGWTLEAAEAVGEGGEISRTEVLDLLSKLVNKSLVMAEAGAEGELRYRMLEPVRQYGWEHLEGSGETEQVRERHARYYLALAERVEPGLMGAQPVPWLERLESEYGNVQAALSWCLDEEDAKPEERAEMGLRLAAALGRFWVAQGLGEGRRWLEKGLARSSASPTSVRAKALIQAGFDALYEGDPGAMALLEEGLALYKELKDRSGVAFAIGNLGHAVVHLGNRERLMTLREEAEALLRGALDRRAAADLLLFLGLAAESETDFEQMEARLEEGLILFRELGDIR